MKILIDPMLAILAQDLPTEDKAELLMCILEYPRRDCGLGLWKYIKQQIDADAKKYNEKCERIAASRQSKKSMKSELKSTLNSDLFSSVSESVSKDNQIKNNVIVSESSKQPAPVDNLFINAEFSFAALCKSKPKFSDYLALYPPPVVERAEKTIRQKRFGQTLSISQILEWLEQENLFYKQNHRGHQ
jgi:hypothetical protein